MVCQFAFLDVGNADSIIVLPESSSTVQSAVIIDIPKARVVSKWLEDQMVSVIDCIFFTHDHRDHIPSLPIFVTFAADWLKSHSINTVCFPVESIRNYVQQLRDSDKSTPQYKRLRHAMDQLLLWEKEKHLNVRRVDRTTESLIYGLVTINILHPTYLFAETHFANNPTQVNETSLVLRIAYGKFVALLLADIEGRGLTELLSNCTPSELKAHLVKIPHHGAWPANSNEFEQLLRIIDAELAIISVGSQNQHGHVVPELFQLLLNLRQDSSQLLSKFLCTEVTRTCTNSTSERVIMGKQGLNRRQICGGDIVINADSSGHWIMQNQTIHDQTIQNIPRSACLGKADIET